ncbi:hypothetical protein CVIRNUC_007570 [Coccomyxa viridis]|uniref:Cupin type-1 domain-containing protein n=1 Tax=Coccomyxa viridis TaxID=1274662 RepID=A0AAV1IAG5_9CHLO|nr:hypothetical protein CVIRNUC_007570 [Coccomyxa viridis]
MTPNRLLYLPSMAITALLLFLIKALLVRGDTFTQHWSDDPQRKFSGGSFKYSNTKNFPGSHSMSASLIKLDVGGIRGLHWHTEAEWAFVLSGVCRSAVMEEGKPHPAETWDFREGDVWYFRPNEGHMVQGLEPDGCTYLAGYNSGTFYDPASPSMGAWMQLLPDDIRGQGLGVAALHQNTTDRIPGFIVQGPKPRASLDDFKAAVMNPPQPAVALTHRYPLSQQAPKAESGGGWVIVADVTGFPISADMAGALVRLEPGGMRQLHWHVNLDEWQYVINGTIQAGVFNSTGHYEESVLRAGDAGFAPVASGHYFKNIGETESYVVLIFNAGRFTNVDLTALVGNIPAETLAADLGITEEVARAMDPSIPTICPPAFESVKAA